ncbi:MAG: hypothetical protein M1816_003182 [Peltula sp. TS41687]|nr:MAG: hypothetical protein M1816_003182 [Peltula sp. TS41687]
MSFPTRPLRTLQGHNGAVHCVSYSAAQGTYALTGCSDRLIRLFNPANGSLIQTYDAHGYEVLDLGVSADNSRFASVGGDKQVFLWDVASARTLRRFVGHFGRVNAVGFGGEGDMVVVSGSFDATVRLWDCRSQSSTKPIQILDEARDSVSSLHVVAHELCTGSVDGRVRLYDLRMGMVSVDVVGHPVTSVRQTKDGAGLLVSTLDSTIRLFDKGNGALLQTYRGHVNKDYRIRSSLGLNDAFVLSGSEDGGIYVWNLLEGKVVKRLGAHGGKVASAVVCNDARKEWLSAGVDGMCLLYFCVELSYDGIVEADVVGLQVWCRCGG